VGSYALASFEDDRCLVQRAERTTRATVEACLFLAYATECGSTTAGALATKTTGRCVEYRIGGVMPIQVVVDADDVVLTRFALYE
jgi:hypothetical protein